MSAIAAAPATLLEDLRALAGAAAIALGVVAIIYLYAVWRDGRRDRS